MPSSGAANLTQRERRELLEEIGHLALTLGRSLVTEPPSSPAPAELPTIPATPAGSQPARPNAITSPYERLQLLLALWRQLERPLMALLSHPDSSTLSAPVTLPLARLASTPQTGQAIARTPRAATAWRHLSGQTPVTTFATTLSHNTLPNCMVVSLLADIVAEATMLGRLATYCEAIAEAEEANRLAVSARQRGAHPALRETPPLSDAERGMRCLGESLTRCAPPYREIARIRQLLHRPLDFDWTQSPLLSLPALESWHLYEIWCYLQVATSLQESGWHLRDGGELLRATPTGLRLTVATGRTSRLCFQRLQRQGTDTLSLYYQPLFVSANREHRENREKRRVGTDGRERNNGSEEREATREAWFCSRSHAMQPDMALSYAGRLILLDPKFKRFLTAEEAQEDIDKMHTYRDAITYRGGTTAHPAQHAAEEVPLPTAVSAAWCLFAGISETEAHNGLANLPTLYAYPTPPHTPTNSPHPYGTAGVGAFRLRPGDTTTHTRLLPFLRRLIEGI